MIPKQRTLNKSSYLSALMRCSSSLRHSLSNKWHVMILLLYYYMLTGLENIICSRMKERIRGHSLVILYNSNCCNYIFHPFFKTLCSTEKYRHCTVLKILLMRRGPTLIWKRSLIVFWIKSSENSFLSLQEETLVYSNTVLET